ncbi:MAG: HAD hydrolase family protein [Promethearchaeota archaeon]
MLKAVFIDFDGCFAEEEPGSDVDLELIQFIRDINQKAESDPTVPFISINSGRPLPYIEAHAQIFRIRNYSIFENGAGIFRFKDSNLDVVLDPKLPSNLFELISSITKLVKSKLDLMPQPGKTYTISYLLPKKDPNLDKIATIVSDFVESNNLDLYIERGVNFININPKGINKGTGLELAAKYSGLMLKEVAAVGDSEGDKKALDITGFSAVPKNAAESLKETADYVSPYSYQKGTMDIIKKIIQSNKNNLII